MDRSGPSRGRTSQSSSRPPNRPPNGPPKPTPDPATGRTAEKRKLLSPKEKADIIKLVDQGASKEEAAKPYNTPVSFVELILQDREKILKDVAKGGSLSSFKIKKKNTEDESNNSPLASVYGPTPGTSYGYDGGAGPSRRYNEPRAGPSRYNNPAKVESYGIGDAFRNNGIGVAFRSAEAVKSESDAKPSSRYGNPAVGDSRRGEPSQRYASPAVGDSRRGEPMQRFTKPFAGNSRTGDAAVTTANFKANYFVLDTKSRWVLHKHHVDFEPNEERRGARHHLMRFHKDRFSGYLFDGSMLYTVSEACSPNESIELSSENRDGQRFAITVKHVGVCEPGDEQYMQVFNIILRNCLRQLNLQEVKRKYCDPNQSRDVPNSRLVVWPGYETAIAQYEYNVLLKTEIAFAVMRRETAYDIWLRCVDDCKRNRSDAQMAFKNAVLGTHVLTKYNNKSYKIDDVDFTMNPQNTFEIKKRGEEPKQISFIQYFQQKYNGTVIRDAGQPMLVSKANRRQRRAGLPELMVLVPELCATTGILDSERADFRTMRSFSDAVRLDPAQRVSRLRDFAQRLDVPRVKETLNFWNFELNPELVNVPGRILRPEEIVFGDQRRESSGHNAEWQLAFRNKKMLLCQPLTNWVLVYPPKMEGNAIGFCKELCSVGPPMGMAISMPRRYALSSDRDQCHSYRETINRAINEEKPVLVAAILMGNNAEKYGEIKRLCILERMIPSQVVVGRTIQPDKKLKSVCTKIAIQMNCKLGGAPWTVPIPSNNLMIVGFDVTHDPRDKRKSYGAMVASVDKACAHYFSILEHHPNGEELSTAFGQNLMKAVENFRRKNEGRVPATIVIFRDGVGDGNVQYVQDQEVNQAKASLAQYYASCGTELKMSFIIVTKKHNTRIFRSDSRQESNPPPGSIVDKVIVMPRRTEFYLISQSVRQGTVSPTHYNVIENTTGWNVEQLQRLTYQMTHLYFNWSGTVKVPAPCQYAHKLAFLTSNYLRTAPQPSANRDSLLYYL